MRRASWVVLLLSFSLYICAPLFGQQYTGTITGTVSDPQGAVVSGAQVTVKNEATGLERTATTNASGVYTVADLPVGAYNVSVKSANFKEFVAKNVAVDPSSTRTLNAALAVGGAGEQITVEASTVQVETNTGAVGNVVEGTEVRELPLNGSNFVQLTQLMPGVSPASFFNVERKGLEGGVDFSVNGNNVTNNLFMVDGVNNNDIGSNRTILIYPSLQAIDEFKILRNSYGPEYGQAAGAIVNIVTRSGSNQLHGGVFYRGRNTSLNATDYFNRHAGIPKDVFHRNDYGFNIGGPAIKDHLFFFWSEEWNKEIRGLSRTAEVPTAAERVGDFTNLRPGTFANGTTACDPVPTSSFAGSPAALANEGQAIPANRLSLAGFLMMQSYPLPNLANPVGCANWGTSLGSPIPWREDNVRGDWHITKTWSLMGRYTFDNWSQPFPSTLGYWGDDIWPGVESNWAQPSRQVTVKLTKLIGSTAVNDLQVSYAANAINITRGGQGISIPSNPLGVASGNVDPTAYTHMVNQASLPWFCPDFSCKALGVDMGQPLFWTNGLVGGVAITGGSGGFNTIGPWHNNEQLLILTDNFSKVMGAHTFKAGFLATQNQKNERNQNASGENGAYWSTQADGWGGPADVNGGTSGNGLFDLLAAGTEWGWGEQSVNPFAVMRWHDFEFYGGDSWKMRRNLTLEYGIRWSLLRMPTTGNDKQAYFVPNLYNAADGSSPCNGMLTTKVGFDTCSNLGLPGATQTSNRALRPQNNHAIQPRLGLAWDPRGDGKTAIRAGFGWFYQRDSVGPLESGSANPPFVFFSPGSVNGGQRQLDNAGLAELTCPAGNPTPCFIGAPSRGLVQNNELPQTYQYNLTVEREITNGTKLELAYVANKGRHLKDFIDANIIPVSSRIPFVECTKSSPFLPACPSSGAFRPFGAGNWGGIPFFQYEGYSNYDALQALFRTRVKAVDAQFAYTYSHSLANTDLTDSSGGLSQGNSLLDPFNPRLDYGNSTINRPHIFVGNIVYTLPALSGQNAFIRHAAGGWELSSILQYAMGPSLSVWAGTGAPNGLVGSGNTAGGNERPNRVPGQDCRAHGGDPLQWLNPNAFTLDHYQLGSDPTTPRGACYGPGIADTDFSVRKNFKITERVTAKFTMDFFNLFNKPQFSASNINQTLSNSSTVCGPGSSTDPNQPWCSGGTDNAGQSFGAYTDNSLFWKTFSTSWGPFPVGNPNCPAASNTKPCTVNFGANGPQGTFGAVTNDRPAHGPREIQYGLTIEF